MRPPLAAALLAAGILLAPSVAAAGATVVATEFAFSPVLAHVTPGATVTVVNAGNLAHTLTGQVPVLGAFATGTIPAGETRTVSAPALAGAYPFVCSFHPSMRGALVVR